MRMKLFLLTFAVALLSAPLTFIGQAAAARGDSELNLATTAPVLLSVSVGACSGGSIATFGKRGPFEPDDFCDTSPDHGSSKSCQEFGEATGEFFECDADEKVTDLRCSKGNSCSQGDGNWCDCSYTCFKKTPISCTPSQAGQTFD